MSNCQPQCRGKLIRFAKAFCADRHGAALIEMAIIAPILISLLLGIVSYGSWIALAHAVQQSANESARASLAGLTQQERAEIARLTANATLARTHGIASEKVSVTVQDDGATLVVNVSYDASANPLLKMPLVSAPSTTIQRRSAVELTGI